MASLPFEFFLAQINATINGTSGTNATEKYRATTEGMAVAYGSLVLMALVPIFIGAFRSVKHLKQQKVVKSNFGELFILLTYDL